MILRSGTILLGLLAVFVAGCTHAADSSAVTATRASAPGNSISDKDAITAAIEKHLRGNTGINMSVMDMTVNDVNVTGDQAQANAEFLLKQGGTSMSITYKLERHAGDWIVLSNQPSGGQFAHPPMDKTHSGSAVSPSTQPLPDVTEFLKNRRLTAGTSQ